jgi:hypothetical protein
VDVIGRYVVHGFRCVERESCDFGHRLDGRAHGEFQLHADLFEPRRLYFQNCQCVGNANASAALAADGQSLGESHFSKRRECVYSDVDVERRNVVYGFGRVGWQQDHLRQYLHRRAFTDFYLHTDLLEQWRLNGQIGHRNGYPDAAATHAAHSQSFG